MNNEYIELANKYASQGECAKKYGDYYGEDGLLYCGKCHTPKQANIPGFDTPRPIVCKCRNDEYEAEKEKEKREKIEQRRKECFGCMNLKSITFEHDRGYNPEISRITRSYVDNFEKTRDKGWGLLLYGPVGSGKSFFGAAIANALIDRDYRVRCATLDEFYRESRAGTAKEAPLFFSSLTSYDLIVIDDLGVEKQSTTMCNFVFSIVDTLYKNKTPFVVTTNLTIEEIKSPANAESRRIYDRLIERCPLPVYVEHIGGSVRRQIVRETHAEYARMLGIDA